MIVRVLTLRGHTRIAIALSGGRGAVYLRVFIESSAEVALRWLVLAVADPEIVPDFGKLVEFGEEFIYRKVCYNKVAIFKGGNLRLPANRDHRVHIFCIFVHIAQVEINAL